MFHCHNPLLHSTKFLAIYPSKGTKEVTRCTRTTSLFGRGHININPSGGTLPSNEGQLPNCSLRLSVEDRR